MGNLGTSQVAIMCHQGTALVATVNLKGTAPLAIIGLRGTAPVAIICPMVLISARLESDDSETFSNSINMF